jgi:hypothetical protein
MQEKRMRNMGLYPWAGAVLAMAYLLAFTGCPRLDDSDDDFDPRLEGTWSNRAADITQKTFVIRPDGSFTASINPSVGGRGTVTGMLIADDRSYIMSGMEETSGTDWKKAVGSFNGTPIQMVFSGNTTFELKCKDNKLVEMFFGASYYRETPGTVFDYSGDNTGNDKEGSDDQGGTSGPAYSLTGSWSNKKEKIAEKTFTIAEDGISFTVSLDPGIGGRGTVTGKLIAEGDTYILQDMKETTGKFWGKIVGKYDKTAVQIKFKDQGTFELKCTNSIVETMFGGEFYRIN